jgi:hypothetical protein
LYLESFTEKLYLKLLCLLATIESHYITLDKSEQYTDHATKQIKYTDQTGTFHMTKTIYKLMNI